MNQPKPATSESSPPIARRELMLAAGAGLLGLSPGIIGTAARALAAPPEGGSASPEKLPALEPLNRFPRMVQEYFVRRVREAERAGNALRNALTTKEEAEKYIAGVRAKIRDCFGPAPEKTPLNAKVTGVLDRDVYKIEKVVFESRPGFFVTANLYLPKGRKGPLPAVVGSCGHSLTGKGEPAYQSFCQGLARKGYVVLIFDPIGQGERLQYPDENLKSRIGNGVREHLHGGNQQFLVDEFFGAWRAWDGIRALDYLLSREEVDPKHVGITGNSGGGTMTTWLCGVESRWTMAAPSCFVTTFRRNMENELPADTEQCPPKVLAQNLDMCDFLVAMAPKPVIVMGQEKDFFDIRGTAETYERLKKIYTLLGVPDNVALHIGPRPHGYAIENREAMYGWFNRATGSKENAKEPEIKVEKDEDLWCTPKGQVATLKSRTLFSFTREKAQTMPAIRETSRAVFDGPASIWMQSQIMAVLHLPKREGPPDFRILRSPGTRRYPKKSSALYAVETEPGVQALVHMLMDTGHDSRPPRGVEKALLYVAHHSSDAEMRDEPLIPDLIKEDPAAAFFACDVRGIGQSKPDTCGGKEQFLLPYGSDFFYAIHSIMLDYPYVGQKTHDLLCVLDWLAEAGHKEVHLAAKGWGTIPATFAALLSPLVTRVTLKNALTSYTELAESEDYKWPLSCMVRGVLSRFDLPECYAALAAKKLKMIEPWGPMAK